jgi:hypothetical protein
MVKPLKTVNQELVPVVGMQINGDYDKLPLAGGSNSLTFCTAAFAAALRSCSAIIPSSDRWTTSLAAIVEASLRAAASTAFNSSLIVAPLICLLRNFINCNKLYLNYHRFCF